MDKPLVYRLLQKLVAMRTVTGDFTANNEALDFIEDFLSSRGMHIHRTEDDGYGAMVATTHDTKEPAVMFVGHIDVVSGPNHIFKLQKRGDKLYGRGTRDMKCSIAAYMAIVDELQDELINYDFGIMIISDEETRDLGAIKFIEEGYVPKSVVLMDGGESWGLEKLAKGALYVAVKMPGKSAHGSRPWLGDSASCKLIELLSELQRDYVGHGPDTDTLNVAQLRAGGTAYNQIPASAEAMLDIRLIDKAHVEPTKTRITELCAKYGATMEISVYFPVLEHDMTNPYIAEFTNSITKITGIKHEHTIAYGASDAVRFDELGIPCAVTYPLSGGHHSDDEWIAIQALFDLPLILRDYLDKVGRLSEAASKSAEELAVV